MFTKLDELKSSIPAPVQTPPTNLIVDALKQHTKALKSLQAEVSNLRASVTTKYELKNALSAIEGQTSTVKQMKEDIISVAGKFFTDVAIAGYCDT